MWVSLKMCVETGYYVKVLVENGDGNVGRDRRLKRGSRQEMKCGSSPGIETPGRDRRMKFWVELKLCVETGD